MFAIIEIKNEEELKNLKDIKVVEILNIESINRKDEDYKHFIEYKKNKHKDKFYSFEQVKKIFE